MEQVIAPIIPWPYVGGWCQGFVEGSFGQASPPQKDKNGNWYTTGPFPSATAAWNVNYGNTNHPNELPPKGVAVAVYFSLGSTPAGHVAISLPDGRVLSSTQGGLHAAGAVHPNLQDLINVYAKYNNGCTYLGWTEFVGKARVVKLKGDDTVNLEAAKQLIRVAKHREPFNLEEAKKYVGLSPADALVKAVDEEWHGQNGVLGILYPQLGEENKKLKEQLSQAEKPAQTLKPGIYKVEEK